MMVSPDVDCYTKNSNYVWLHLQSSQKRVKRLLRLCGYGVPKTYFSQHNQVNSVTFAAISGCF